MLLQMLLSGLMNCLLLMLLMRLLLVVVVDVDGDRRLLLLLHGNRLRLRGNCRHWRLIDGHYAIRNSRQHSIVSTVIDDSFTRSPLTLLLLYRNRCVVWLRWEC